MEPSQYAAARAARAADAAAPPPGSPLVRLGRLVPPALLVCALVGLAGGLVRVWTGMERSFDPVVETQPDASLPLRFGSLLADASAMLPVLLGALGLVVLATTHQLGARAVPVTDAVRRAGSGTALTVSLTGLAFTVSTLLWVATTHGVVSGDSADGITFGRLELDPWSTLLAQGTVGLLTLTLAAAAAVLLLGPPPRSAAGTTPGGGDVALEEAGAGRRAPDAVPGPPSPGSPAAAPAPSAARTDPIGSGPAGTGTVRPDPAAFRRPGSPDPADGSMVRVEPYRRPSG